MRSIPLTNGEKQEIYAALNALFSGKGTPHISKVIAQEYIDNPCFRLAVYEHGTQSYYIELLALLRTMGYVEQTVTTQATPEPLQAQIQAHAEITDKKLLIYLWYIATSKDGNKVMDLLLGKWRDRYENKSAAMFALADYLVFWTDGDTELAYRMFCCSKLYGGSKYDAFVWSLLERAKQNISPKTPEIIRGWQSTTGRTKGIKSKLIVSYIITIVITYAIVDIDNYIDWYSSKNKKPYCLTLPSVNTLTPKDTSTIERLLTLLTWDDGAIRNIQAQADITLTTEGVALLIALRRWLLFMDFGNDGYMRVDETTLAKRAGVSVSTVKRWLVKLRKYGIVDYWRETHNPKDTPIHLRMTDALLHGDLSALPKISKPGRPTDRKKRVGRPRKMV